MYTLPELKQIYKKSIKIKNSIERSIVACNSVVYTEQNTEELNDVKNYLSYKLDLITDILTYIKNFLKNSSKLTLEEISFVIQNYTNQFNDVSKDYRLRRLEQIYTRQINKEVVGF